MRAELSRLQSPAEVQAALEEFARIGRPAFLERYGKSRGYLVRDKRSGEMCDAKAVIGAGYGYQVLKRGLSSPGPSPGEKQRSFQNCRASASRSCAMERIGRPKRLTLLLNLF